MARTVRWLLIPAVLAALLVAAASAAALPANPWSGRWLDNQGAIVTLTQSGSQITGTSPCPGTTGAGVTYSATASSNNTTASFSYMSSECTGTGGTFSATMDAGGMKVTGTGTTQFGTGFSFTWVYQSGGTEPRSTPTPPPAPPVTVGCRTAANPWEGRWGFVGLGVVDLQQTGSSVRGLIAAGEGTHSFTGSVSGATLTGTATSSFDGSTTQATFTMQSPTSISLAFSGNSPLASPTTFRGDYSSPPGRSCPPLAASTPAPNLQTTIPNPQTLSNGPTSLVAPRKISLRSLKRSKCVLVKVASRRPARVLVSIFSGRLSIRLFGQKLVVFLFPGRKQPCIPVPFRAHTFNVRTPLNVALGYTAGSRPQRGGRKPKPVIKPISLVP